MKLRRVLESDKTLRAVGFDDEPFDRDGAPSVGLAGVVCKQTRFDGMVWDRVEVDGRDATETVRQLLASSKFLPQLHAILLDGIAFGGFNVVDLPRLAEALDLPCIAVMRERPDFEGIRRALEHVDDSEERFETIRRAGDVRAASKSYFQASGCETDVARAAVDALTVTGHIPEPLRIAHLVATAVARGESGRRA